jgi:hypothetical protein
MTDFRLDAYASRVLAAFRAAAVVVAVAVAFGAVLGSHSAIAQDGGAEGVLVRGFVTDQSDGSPLPGANVVLEPTAGPGERRAGATSRDGLFQIPDVQPGTYAFRVSFVGYQTHVDTLQISESWSRVLRISLTPAKQVLDEVTVESERESDQVEGGEVTVLGEDLNKVPTPGIGGDISGYLQTLPGVTALGDQGGQLYVRGGTPSQNLVLVDGIPVFRPFHVIGFFSAIPGDLVSKADFYPGGFPARYTGRLSSVLDISTRPGNTKQHSAKVGGSPFLASLRIGGPLSRGESSYLLSVRSSLVEETAPAYLDDETPLYFNDALLRLHSTGADNQCGVTAMHTYDRGRLNPNRDETFRWRNLMAGARCLSFGPQSSTTFESRIGFTYHTNEVSTPEGLSRGASGWSARVNLDLENPYRWGNLGGGIRLNASRYDYEFQEQYANVGAGSAFFLTLGGYTDSRIDVGEVLSVEPGVAGLWRATFGAGLEPRLRVTVRPWGDRRRLYAATGWYRQIVEGVTDERDVGSVFRAYVPSPSGQGASTSVHGVLGWKQPVGDAVRVKLEGYYREMYGLPVSKVNAVITPTTALVNTDGVSYGAEAQVNVDRGWFSGFVGYGWGWVEYESDDEPIGQGLGEPIYEYHPVHDRRHQITVNATAEAPWFTALVNWQYGSPRPFTQLFGTDSSLELRNLDQLPRSDVGETRTLFERPYSSRLPAYHRLDVALRREVTLTEATVMEAELGAINVYNRNNLFYFDLSSLERIDQLPIVPYLSVTVELN